MLSVQRLGARCLRARLHTSATRWQVGGAIPMPPGGFSDKPAETRGVTVGSIMSRNVALTQPSDSVQEAARLMATEDCGFVPVSDKDRLVGMVTDR